MAGVAASLPSAGRHTGTTLGVAISGTIVGSAMARGGMAFTSAEHAVRWTALGLGAGIAVLALLSTGRRASGAAARAAALFEKSLWSWDGEDPYSDPLGFEVLD